MIDGHEPAVGLIFTLVRHGRGCWRRPSYPHGSQSMRRRMGAFGVDLPGNRIEGRPDSANTLFAMIVVRIWGELQFCSCLTETIETCILCTQVGNIYSRTLILGFPLAAFRIILSRPHNTTAVSSRLAPTMPKSELAQSFKSFEASGDCDAPLYNPGLIQAHRTTGRPCDPEEIELKVVGAYGRFAPSLRSYLVVLCKNVDQAQDAVQEAFLRYYVTLTNGEEIHNDRAWLFRVARNYLLDMLKDHAVKNHVSLGAAEMSQKPAYRPSPESECLRAEILQLAFGKLSSREKECLQLR